jgi:hypothetical protein
MTSAGNPYVHVMMDTPESPPPPPPPPAAAKRSFDGGSRKAAPPASFAAPPRVAAWLRRVPLDQLRAPTQMFVALFVAGLLATAQKSSDAFHHHASWVGARAPTTGCVLRTRCPRLTAACAAITVAIALETNVGATSRKASLRAVGTLAGGALAVTCVGLTAALNAGWAPGAPPGKVASMSFLLAFFGAGVQFFRARDPSHDYACVTHLHRCAAIMRARLTPRASPRQLRRVPGHARHCFAVGLPSGQRQRSADEHWVADHHHRAGRRAGVRHLQHHRAAMCALRCVCVHCAVHAAG